MTTEPRRVAINPAGLVPPYRPFYSHCVKVTSGPLLFIAGQIAVDKDGKVIGKGDVKKQAIHIIENIKTILEANGARLADVVKVTVFVTDMRHLPEVTEVRSHYFPSQGPASTMVEVSKLAVPDLLIEIDAIAVVP